MKPLSCLFKNEYFYAIHKPANVPFHSLDDLKQDQELTHVEGIVSLAKKFLNDPDIYPVHRLDRMTSGLMIFARSPKANSELSRLFQEKKIEKYYLALSEQKPKKKQGAVIGDMTKGRSGSYLLKRSKDKPAITRFFAHKIRLGAVDAWFYTLKPETGKTHQLRVALKSLGSPVMGDKRYSGASASRGYLHAYKVRFDLFGKRYEIIDSLFEGEEFALQNITSVADRYELADQDDRLYLSSPEQLPWPKASFLLS
tara:strand:+ start:35780 stop:36544 length:765 start_codon:yes stop_codon:yes gene_type:complete